MVKTGDIIAYEDNEMDKAEEIRMFQELVNNGQAWRLQGSYGRAAMDMIEAGLITLGEHGHYDYYGNYVPSKHEVEPGTKGSQEYADEMNHSRELGYAT